MKVFSGDSFPGVGLAGTALLVSLLPILLLSAYNHPSTDDFCQGIRVHDAPARGETRLQALAVHTVWFYKTWGGRYTTAVACSLCPIAFDWWAGYRISSIAICLLLLAACFCLFHTVNRFIVKAPGAALFPCAVGFMILYLARMPSLAEGLFWHSGYVTHTFPLILSLFLYAALIRFFYTGPGRRKNLIFCVLLLLLFLAVGGNEIAMAFTLFLVTAVFLLARRKRRVGTGYLAALIVGAIAFASLEILSPGNALRAASAGCSQVDRGLLPVLARTIRLCADHTSAWILSPDFLMFTALGLGLFLRLDPTAAGLLSRNLAAILALSLVGYLLLWLPPAYAIAAVPPRALNTIYCHFLLLWLAVIFSLAARLFGAARRLPPIPAGASSVLLLALLARALLWSGSNVNRAYRDLLDDSAGAYDRQMESRYRAIAEAKKNGRTDRLVLSTLAVKPKSIFVGDITADPSDWRNIGYQSFFKIKEVVIGGERDPGEKRE